MTTPEREGRERPRRWAVRRERGRERAVFVVGDFRTASRRAREIWRWQQMYDLIMQKPHIEVSKYDHP